MRPQPVRGLSAPSIFVPAAPCKRIHTSASRSTVPLVCARVVHVRVSSVRVKPYTQPRTLSPSPSFSLSLSFCVCVPFLVARAIWPVVSCCVLRVSRVVRWMEIDGFALPFLADAIIYSHGTTVQEDARLVCDEVLLVHVWNESTSLSVSVVFRRKGRTACILAR